MRLYIRYLSLKEIICLVNLMDHRKFCILLFFFSFFIIKYFDSVKQAIRSCRKYHKIFSGDIDCTVKKKRLWKKREDCIWVVAIYTNAKTGFRKWNSVRMPKNASAAITTSF